MIIPIPTGVSYTSTMVGTAAKHVACEYCQTEFVYLIRRTASGVGTSELYINMEGAAERAHRTAERRLREALARGAEIIACPMCGCFQPEMMAWARHRRVISLAAAGAVLLVAYGGLWQFSTPPFSSMMKVAWGLPGLLGLVALLAGVLAWAAFRDMNAGADKRKGFGSGKVMLRSDFEALVAAQVQPAPSGGPA